MFEDFPSTEVSGLNKKWVVVLALIGIIAFVLFTLSQQSQAQVHIQSAEEATPASSPVNLFVDISGAVNFPGVYKVASSARMHDVVALAGGFSENADLTWISRSINLAKKLEDEGKIYIPFQWDIQNNATVTLDKLV